MNKKWVVLNENPKPDDYIAVMIADAERMLKIERQPCAVFTNGESAMEYARLLQKQFQIRRIRIFHLDGHSENILNSRQYS
jgi:hypothetical protein